MSRVLEVETCYRLAAEKLRQTQVLEIPPENSLPVHAVPQMLSADAGALNNSLTKFSELLPVAPNERVHPPDKIRRASGCSQSSLDLDIHGRLVILFMVELQSDGIEALVYQNKPTSVEGFGLEGVNYPAARVIGVDPRLIVIDVQVIGERLMGVTENEGDLGEAPESHIRSPLDFVGNLILQGHSEVPPEALLRVRAQHGST